MSYADDREHERREHVREEYRTLREGETMNDKQARVDKGSAMSTAFVFDRFSRFGNKPKGEQHAAVSVHADGSGRISIYSTYRVAGKPTKVLQRAAISLSTEDFQVIREAINSQIPIVGGR